MRIAPPWKARSGIDEAYGGASIARGEIVALDPDALARVLIGAWAEATLYVLRTGERSETVAVVEHIVESLRPPIVEVTRGARPHTTGRT